MVIAIGSYPIGRRFESHRRYQRRQAGLAERFCKRRRAGQQNTAPWSSGLRRRSFAEAAAGSCSKNFAPQAQAPGGDTGTKKRKYGPMVKRSKTSPFHGGNPGSSPGGVTKQVKGELVSIRRRVRFYRVFQNIEKRRGLRRKLPPRFCGHIPLLPLCRTRHFPDRVHRRRRRAGRICRGPR